MFRPGDAVRLKTLPEFVSRLPEESVRVFVACVGGVFPVTEITDDGLLVLDVSATIDHRFGGYANDIRVEPRYVDRV